MENPQDNKIHQQLLVSIQKNGDPPKSATSQILIQDGKPITSIFANQQDTQINDPKACQDSLPNQDDCGDNETSSVHKREKSKRLSKKPKRLYDDQMLISSQQSPYKRQRIDGDSQLTDSPKKGDKDEFGAHGIIQLDDISEDRDHKPTNKVKQKHGHKKQNFTAVQTQILKRWFIQNADNPYLKEENRKELSEKTGLDQRQVSNWFTNVRKRVWQPLKKKNKNKSINDIMLKVKLKLEADPIQQSGSVYSSSDYSVQDHCKDPTKLRHNKRGRNTIEDLHKLQQRQMIEEAQKVHGIHGQLSQQICQNQLTASHNPFNLVRSQPQGSQLTQFQNSLMIGQYQSKLPNNQSNQQLHQIQQSNHQILSQHQQHGHQHQQQQNQQQQTQQGHSLNQPDKFIMSLIDQLQRQNEIRNQQSQQQQQSHSASLNTLPKNLQSILKDPNAVNKSSNIISQQIAPQVDNSQILQFTNKLPNQLFQEKHQNLPQINQNGSQHVHWSQAHPINSILGIQSKPQQIASNQQQQFMLRDGMLKRSSPQHQNLIQHGLNLNDIQIQSQADIHALKMKELIQQNLVQKQSMIKSPNPLPTQQIQIPEQLQGHLQQIQTELLQSTNHIHKSIRQQTSNMNLQEFDSKPQDNIINTQATQKESGQEDLRSLTSKLHMSKNLIDIDFKKNEKDASLGHSVVEKDKSGGAINYGVMSDTSLQQATGHRNALKKLLQKKLRFHEKMKNVQQWRTSQLEFAVRNAHQLEDPAKDEMQINQTLDAEKFEMIEKEFIEHSKLVEQLAKQKALEKDHEHKNLSRDKLKQKERNSSGRRQDGFRDDEGQSNEGAEVVSLHNSKSLMAQNSLSQVDDSVNNLNSINAPFQFIPIVLVSCPNVVKGGECKCGYDGFYPANDFYKNQLQQFISNQSQLFNPFQRDKSSSNNTGGSGGSRGSDEAKSCNGKGRGGSTSNTNGNSWQTTANYPHPFLALLHQFNQQANFHNSGKKNKPPVDSNFQSQLSGVRNMTELIQKFSNTFTQYKDKLKEKQLDALVATVGTGTGNTQATLNQATAANLPAQSNQQEETAVQQTVENGGSFDKPQDPERRDAQKQQNGQHTIPPQVNFISHLEQASLLKNQLEVLNEITNQFHELMRLDKIKQKIVQFQKDQGQDAAKKDSSPRFDQGQLEADQTAVRDDLYKHSNDTFGPPMPAPALNKVHYHTSDTEQVAPSQVQTLKQRIKRNSRTMSEHKSSQNHSHTNMHPAPISGQNSHQMQAASNSQNQNTLIINQLQSVLSLLYNQQKGGNKVGDDPTKQKQHLQIVQLLKEQSMANRATQRAQNIPAASIKSTRPTDGTASHDAQLPSLSGNWQSNKNMRAESAILSASNNKNFENDQIGIQNKQINSNNQTVNAHLQQSNYEPPIDSSQLRQNTQNAGANMGNMAPKIVTDETKFDNQMVHGQQFNTQQAMQDKAGIERQLPPLNSLNVGQQQFEIPQQLIKNGSQASIPTNAPSNNAPIANQATESANNTTANANNAQVNLGEQDQYSLLQLLLPLDRSSHNM